MASLVGNLKRDNPFLRYVVNDYADAYQRHGKDVNTPAIIANGVSTKLSGSLLCERFLNNAVSLFVTLGLFGTFLGLSLSVSSLTEMISYSNTSEWLSVLDSVGGGLMMNAGAYGGELKDAVESVVIHFLPEQALYELTNENCAFGYRTSLFQKMPGCVILSAVFRLKEGDRDAIAEKMRELNTRRRDKQPLDLPSAGSAFKRPKDGYAAALIDEAGLKGYSIGGAQVSEKHAGFVVSDANAIRRRVILEARERGEVILACMHLNNPKTGNSSWLEYEGDKEAAKKAVKEILTEGTATRTKYLSWLDRCADFAGNLKDSRGNLIPVIFRPFHEHTQSWSWWGTSCATDAEFIELWRMTVKYLRDTKEVHNFLYSVSPQMDAVYSDTKGRLLYRWPGDDWVDFIGMDCYHGTNDTAFGSNLEALEALSKEKRKPCGVTEDGKESFTEVDFWSRHVLAPVGNKRISMVTMWRNKYVGNNESDKHYFSVYPGHPSEDDFRAMYNDPRSLFSRDLPDMYTLPDGYEIK